MSHIAEIIERHVTPGLELTRILRENPDTFCLYTATLAGYRLGLSCEQSRVIFDNVKGA